MNASSSPSVIRFLAVLAAGIGAAITIWPASRLCALPLALAFMLLLRPLLRRRGLLRFGGAAVAAAAVYAGFITRVYPVATVLRPLTRLEAVDRFGRLLAVEGAVLAPVSRLGPFYKCVVAIEDRGFEGRGGRIGAVDFRGLGAAVASGVTGNGWRGASTIPEQLVKLTYTPWPEKLAGKGLKKALWVMHRKAVEAVVGSQAVACASRGGIFELYAARANYGNGAHGVEAAAYAYFSKDLLRGDALNYGQAAMLAALLNAPEGLNPLKHPEKLEARRQLIIAKLLQEKMITAAEAAEARKPIALRTPAPIPSMLPANEAYAFLAEVKRASEREGVSFAGGGTFIIHTTADADMQRTATEVLREGARAIEARPEFRAAHGQDGLHLQGGAAVLEAHGAEVGAIRALAGSVGPEATTWSHCTVAELPPASLVKPIEALSAMRRGIPLWTKVDNRDVQPGELKFAGWGNWAPHNSHVAPGTASLRDALIHSWNVPWVITAATHGGLPPVFDDFERVNWGRQCASDPNVLLGQGTMKLSLLRIAGAYTVFAPNAGGAPVRPYLIERVEKVTDGMLRPIFEHQAEPVGARYDLRHVLEVREAMWAVARVGTAAGGLRGQPLTPGFACKTGTTDEATSVSTVAIDDQHIAGVAYTFSKKQAKIYSTADGGTTAAPVCAKILKGTWERTGGKGSPLAAAGAEGGKR